MWPSLWLISYEKEEKERRKELQKKASNESSKSYAVRPACHDFHICVPFLSSCSLFFSHLLFSLLSELHSFIGFLA